MSDFALNRFYSYAEVEQLLFALRDAHPDICTLEDFPPHFVVSTCFLCKF